MKKVYPILSWLVMFFSFILAVFHRYSPAVLLEVFITEFGMSTTTFALLSSTFFFLYALLQLPIGFLLDFYGPRKIGTYSLMILSLGSLIFSFATGTGMLFIGRLTISVGAASVWGTLIKIQALHFSGKSFATLTGVAGIAGSLGVIFAGIPFLFFIQLISWRQTMFMISLLTLGLFVAALFFIREDAANSMDRERDYKEALARTCRVLQNRNSWLAFTAHFGINGSYAALLGIWTIPFLVSRHGFTQEAAATVLLITGIGFMLGAPIQGMASEVIFKGSRRPTLLLSTLCLSVLIAGLLIISKDHLAIWIQSIYFLTGFFSGSVLTTMVFSKDVNPPEDCGVAVGFVNCGGFIGAAVAQLTAGIIMEKGLIGEFSQNIMYYPPVVFTRLIWFSVFLLALSFVSIIFARQTPARLGGFQYRQVNQRSKQQ
jgi:predicted MFS family arabinose efflux permease